MDNSRSSAVWSGVGQSGPDCSSPCDEAPKSCSIRLQLCYSVPPSGISNNEKFVLGGQMCRPGEQDLTLKTKSTGSHTPFPASTSAVQRRLLISNTDS